MCCNQSKYAISSASFTAEIIRFVFTRSCVLYNSELKKTLLCHFVLCWCTYCVLNDLQNLRLFFAGQMCGYSAENCRRTGSSSFFGSHPFTIVRSDDSHILSAWTEGCVEDHAVSYQIQGSSRYEQEMPRWGGTSSDYQHERLSHFYGELVMLQR